ncbi:MAG: peptidoglycan-binding protein [Candidatus Omnitrophica bacterium]|nr:peptidoglycan-binding protein [Candidatus Omnitrophota bacterium]
MWGGRVLALVAVAALASGCAGARTSQELARLQSQVGLLDERMTQLERSGVGGAFTTGSFIEPGADAGTTVTSAAPAKKSSAGKSAGTPSAAKPTTRQIQQALKNAGFYQGTVDGKSGPMTKDAVKEFQRVHGLVDDGVVGKQTWTKLKAYADLSAAGDELNAAEPLK